MLLALAGRIWWGMEVGSSLGKASTDPISPTMGAEGCRPPKAGTADWDNDCTFAAPSCISIIIPTGMMTTLSSESLSKDISTSSGSSLS